MRQEVTGERKPGANGLPLLYFNDSPGWHGFRDMLASQVVCLLGSEEILFVLRRVRETLEADGRIAILDIMLEDSRTHPPDAAIFAVNMLLTTESGL